MAIFLEITSGSESGKNFEVFEGLKIGRSVGDIILDDDKVSALHAEVALDNKNQLTLYDRGSSNGLRLSGKKVSKIRLLEGVEFGIGDHIFRVSDVSKIAPEQLAGVQKKRTWKEKLQDHLKASGVEDRKGGNPLLHGFPQFVELEFLQGPQFEERVLLGYGPREAGYFSMDIPLKEEGWPSRAFVITWANQKGMPRIQNLVGEKLKMNGKEFLDHEIKGGEEIEFQNTLIKFRLREPGT